MAPPNSSESPIGDSPYDNGGGAEVGKNVGKINISSQAAIDKSAFKELNTEFKELSKHITKFKQDLPTLIADTKKWATELGKVATKMKAIGKSQGVGEGAPYMQAAGTLVGSGNITNVNKTVVINEAGGGDGGGGTPPTKAGSLLGKAQPYIDFAGQILGAMDSRAARGAAYGLSADRMNMLYQQMYGGSQNQTYHQFREPLQKYKLGMGGINTLLGLQASTGLNAQQQAGSIEALRAATGYAYSTEQLAGMTKSLAGPESTNQLFMTLGTGMYGIGGKQKTQQQVYQDIITRTGLTNEQVLKGAFQQGSMTRARLSMAGVSEDQQDLILQYAQQNVTYRKKGGTGFYDPSKKEQRELMGVEGNYANQAEETERVKSTREENFYKRQADNFATFEKATQSVTKALQAFEEKLSGIAGAGISSKAHRGVFSSISKWGGRALSLVGAATLQPELIAAGVGLEYLGGKVGGDPIDGINSRRKTWGVRTNTELGGDATTTDTPSEAKLSNNNKNKLAQLDPKLREPLKKMLLANPKLEIGDAKRSGARQDASFRRRYSKAPAGVTKKTKDADRIWNGEVWIYDKHAENGPPMAPPGQSMHEIGLAADLSQSENEWVRANAASFGLAHGGTQKGSQTDEPFHVQPAGIPFGRGEYEKSAGISDTPVGTAVVSGMAPEPSTSSTASSGAEISPVTGVASAANASVASNSSLTNPFKFAYAGMSMGEVIGSGSVYASSTIAGAGKPSPSYPTASAGGDPVSSPIKGTDSSMTTNSYTITVSPNLTIQSSGNTSFDIHKMAKDVANLLEKEVRMTMMRVS